jgi:hypothetical protein
MPLDGHAYFKDEPGKIFFGEPGDEVYMNGVSL